MFNESLKDVESCTTECWKIGGTFLLSLTRCPLQVILEIAFTKPSFVSGDLDLQLLLHNQFQLGDENVLKTRYQT